MSYRQLLYTSKASDDFDVVTMITGILDVAVKENEKHAISGLLVYDTGHFIQCIEGSDKDVQRLLKNMTKDKRHRDIKVLLDHQIAERDFPIWLMGFTSTSVIIPEHDSIVQLELSDLQTAQPKRSLELILDTLTRL